MTFLRPLREWRFCRINYYIEIWRDRSIQRDRATEIYLLEAAATAIIN